MLVANALFNARTSRNVTYETLNFFENFLGKKLPRDGIKAFYILLNTETEFQLPTVTIKIMFLTTSWKNKKKRVQIVKNHINAET